MENKTIIVDVNKLNSLMEFILNKNIPESVKLLIKVLIDDILTGKYSPDEKKIVENITITEKGFAEIVYHIISKRI